MQSTCPAQPCITLAQLRDQFFVLNDGYNQTAPIGDTFLVFLSGNHSLKSGHSIDVDFIRVGDYASISITGYNDSDPAIIQCNADLGPFFSAFERVLISDLRFEHCTTYVWQNELLVVNNVVFDSSRFDVQHVAFVNISNVQMTFASQVDCLLVDLYGIFFCNASQISLTNGTFLSIKSDCGDTKFIVVNSGYLMISNSVFSGKAVHIVASSTTLNASGTTLFKNGNNAILAVSSTVSLAGNISFINNTGIQGGAVCLRNSRVTIADNARVVFQDNHADFVGGAIFDSGNDISDYVSIGQPVVDSCQVAFSPNSTVEFINNTAEGGGSAMYGITVSNMVCTDGLNQYDTLSRILTIEPDDFSAVSSDPLRVCICPDQSTPDCLAILPDQNIPHLHYTVYPGETFTVPVAVVGFNFAFTGGPVYAQFLNSDAALGSEFQKIQDKSHTGCSQLEYSVLSDKQYETLVLTTDRKIVAGFPSSTGVMRDITVLNENEMYIVLSSLYNYFPNSQKYYNEDGFVMNQTDGVFRMAGHLPRSLQDTPVFISLTLLECPLGFTLSDRPHRCDCDEVIIQQNLTCNIKDLTVRREGTIWINTSISSGVIFDDYCPFDYCKQEPVDVDLTNPDVQCAFNRSGILCGACKPQFSLALGSNRCLPKCSNRYLSLLIPFVLAGFALVFFIKILNLTVSQGTLNGLIFYANIVEANRSVFFEEQSNKFISFLSVFISWLNLDLGIETCFIKGLDAYWKTWLQFVFPFYVWAIAGGIILFSHYSMRATRLFGRNSIAVLATLLLLSYAKLLRPIISGFSFTFVYLDYPANSTSTVWVYDGNLQYFSPKRIPLFLFAVIIGLLWLPYTAVLLSAQWLRTKTHRKGLRWLKPFLDAYYGPFKDKHYYWVGILLLARGLLLIIFSFYFGDESNLNLLLVVVSSISLVVFTSITGRRYKKTYLSALENSFFLNLGILAAGTLYITLAGGSQEALVTISVGISFLQFVGIVGFHGYQFVIIPLRKKKQSFEAQEGTAFQLTTPLIFENKVVLSTEVNISELEDAADDPCNPDRVTQAGSDNTFSTTSSTGSHEAIVPQQSKAAGVPLGRPPPPPPPNGSSMYHPPRYFAAVKRELESSVNIDFSQARESLLDCT